MRYVPLVLVLGIALCARTETGWSNDHVAPETGAVRGTIVYRPDSQRPWRFARYYVKNRKQGTLAEAIVALRGNSSPPAEKNLPRQTIEIDQRDYQFVPELVSIMVGDTIRFKNSDAQTHNVFSSSSLATFNTTMPAHSDFSFTFPRAGGIQRPVHIGCVFHGGMRAWVFVFAHKYHQLTKEDGRFEFQDVPPGQYQVDVRHPAGSLSWDRRIDVRAGEIVDLEVVLSPDDLAGDGVTHATAPQ